MTDKELTAEILKLSAEVAALRAELQNYHESVDKFVVSQVKDHGKRIRALEQRMAWIAGFSAAVGAAVSWALNTFAK